jgi:hypothetical protein
MNKGSIMSGAFGRWKSLLLGAAFAVINLPALAVPITYTLTGTGTGTVGATPFTSAAYTITVVGDTAAVAGGPIFSNVVTGTMTIAGIGTATITEPVIVFDNQNVSTFGFGRPGSDLLDLNDAAFATYALATNLGPIPGLTALSLNQFVSLASTLGSITMPTSGPVTFQVTTGAPPPPPPPAAGIPVPTLGEYGLLLLALLTGTVAALRLRSRPR